MVAGLIAGEVPLNLLPLFQYVPIDKYDKLVSMARLAVAGPE
jgi:hypothetical protein